MEKYSPAKVLTFIILNAFSSIATFAAIFLLLLFMDTLFPFIILNFFADVFWLILIFFIMIDIVKWVASYFIIRKQQKLWYIFFALYIALFIYIAFYFPSIGVIAIAYIVVFIYIELFQRGAPPQE